MRNSTTKRTYSKIGAHFTNYKTLRDCYVCTFQTKPNYLQAIAIRCTRFLRCIRGPRCFFFSAVIGLRPTEFGLLRSARMDRGSSQLDFFATRKPGAQLHRPN